MIGFIGTLGELARGRDNNFNLIRMLAASGVLVSHAYPIGQGPGADEPLEPMLGGISLGAVSVYVFFVVSGFFISQSFERSVSISAFLRARILRLFPALIVVLMLTVIACGIWLTTASSRIYWHEVPLYIFRNVTLFVPQYDLPGVFEDNPYPMTINGSLWTLSHEVLCYTGVFLVGIAGLLRNPYHMALVFLFYILVYAVGNMLPVPTRVERFLDLSLPFALGTAFYIWRDKVVLDIRIALVLAFLAVLVRLGPGTETLIRPALVLVIGYSVFLLGHLPGATLRLYNRLGDYSYGMYIYAFPMQQLMASVGLITPAMNIAASAGATLACAVLSWHLIERPALRLKVRSDAPRVCNRNVRHQ